tara:strand:+ start:1397 stop:1507 length:111 start_codon:yes stop_codon:yes gene_type:complete
MYRSRSPSFSRSTRATAEVSALALPPSKYELSAAAK